MKKILALLLAVIMVMSFAACGNPEPTPGPTDPSKNDGTVAPTGEGKTEVTLKVWGPSEDQAEGGWLLKMEEEFAAAHPEYKITWENSVCSEADAGSLVTADPAAAGDVYMFANDQLGTLINANAISKLGGDFEAQVKNDNSQTLVNTVTYTDGKIYGFPMTNNCWFMYYNKDVFSEEDVKSLDTMLTKGVVAFPWGNGWYNGTFFFANGGTMFGDQGIDGAAGIQFGKDNGGYEAALKMVQLAANENFKDDVDNLGMTGLMTGDVDAYFSGSWHYADLYAALGEKLGAVQLPTVEIGGAQKQMKAFAGSKAVGVNPNASNPKAATQFAAFLASEAAQKARYEMRGVIPAAKNLAADESVKSNMVAVAEINTMTNTSVGQPTIPEMGQFWTPAGNFGGLISNGEVNESNYKEQVDQMMGALNNTGL
jgi:arabinogalactan oligomer/maltooligosaccharide transport system substrate-binding protein